MSLPSDLIENYVGWLKQEFEKDEKIFCASFTKRIPVIERKQPPEDVSVQPLILPELKGAEILLITNTQDPAEQTLLRKMSEAIDKHIAKACLIEEQFVSGFSWEQILIQAEKARWILISEMELYQISNLMMLYEKKPKRSLLKIPIFLLADLKAYLKNIELKKELWMTLRDQL